jgi:hypothetical protein
MAAQARIGNAREVASLQPACVGVSPYAANVRFWKGNTLAHIEWPKPARWRDMLWLVMTAVGVLLLAYAALFA